MSFLSPANGQTILHTHIAQFVNALTGLSGEQISLTGYSSAVNYALTIRNQGAGGLGLKVQDHSNTTIMTVADAGATLTVPFGGGVYRTTGQYLADASAAGSVANAGLQVYVGSYEVPASFHDAALVVEKSSSFAATTGTNAAAAIMMRHKSGDHATGLFVQVTSDLGVHFAEAIRATGSYLPTANGGVVEGLVGIGESIGTTVGHKPGIVVGVESGTVTDKGDAPVGSATDGAAFNTGDFIAGFYAANGAAGGADSVADAAYYVASLSPFDYRVGFLAGDACTEAFFRGLGTTKRALDFRDATLTKAVLSMASGQKIRGAWNASAGAATALFQTDDSLTTNGATNLAVIPVGSGTSSSLTLFNTAASTDIAVQLLATTNEARLTAYQQGGTAPPLSIYTGSTPAQRWAAMANGDVVHGTAALATNATAGFLFIETCAGTPTGTPTTYTGRVPLIYDTTNNRLYVYNGAWKNVLLS